MQDIAGVQSANFITISIGECDCFGLIKIMGTTSKSVCSGIEKRYIFVQSFDRNPRDNGLFEAKSDVSIKFAQQRER